MHMLRTVRNKTHDAEALVHACSTWARYERERILLDRPLPFKLHQSYRPYRVYSHVARNLVGSREKQCGDDGDDLNTAVASHYRGEAVMRLSSQP